MLLLIILLPLCAGIASWFIAADGPRRALLLCVAGGELLMAGHCWIDHPASIGGELLTLDAMGLMVLTVTTLLFFAASLYAVGYLGAENAGRRKDHVQGLFFFNAPETTFTACLLIFLSAAALVACTHHLGLLWVGIETTTLVSAPLIYFHRHRRSLEATWKYLIICSVGMALALIGNILLDVSMQTQSNEVVPITLNALLSHAGNVHMGWFKAAFVFMFIGYGTKMGVSPMHTWLPDAYSEAPSISTLLSGALLNCAFLGIFRAYQISLAAGTGEFASSLFIAFGLLSMMTAAFFIVGQGDFRRMLAYSSVEHMGVLLLAVGVGFKGSFAGIFHMVNHSLVKAGLFLLAGNIVAKYSTRSSHDVTGMHAALPVTGFLWLCGTLALLGAPPFGLFLSEFMVLQGILARGYFWLALVFVLLLGIIFVGMITPVLRMYKGRPPYGTTGGQRESFYAVAPTAFLFALALVLGVYMPNWLLAAMRTATGMIARY